MQRGEAALTGLLPVVSPDALVRHAEMGHRAYRGGSTACRYSRSDPPERLSLNRARLVN